MKLALVPSCFVVQLARLIAHVRAGRPSIAPDGRIALLGCFQADGRLSLLGQTEVSHVAANVQGSSGRDLDPEDSEKKGRALSPGEKKRAERALKEVRRAEDALAKANSALEDADESE